jgi:putative membrane protein
MQRTLLTILATALSLLVVDIIFPGVRLANFPIALVAGAVIGLVNSSVKPVISTLSLPLNLVSLGAFSLVINGLCFWLASILVPGFVVKGLIAFIVAPVILSSVNTFLSQYFVERYPQLTTEKKFD